MIFGRKKSPSNTVDVDSRGGSPDYGNPLGFSKEDIEAFKGTGASDADLLLRGYGRVKRGVYGGQRDPFLGYYTDDGRDINDLVTRFVSWKNKRIETSKQYDEYLKRVQDQPGREGTVLVPLENNTSKTLLGTSMVQTKTVFGG